VTILDESLKTRILDVPFDTVGGRSACDLQRTTGSSTHTHTHTCASANRRLSRAVEPTILARVGAGPYVIVIGE